jgi:hypothetical protein
MNKEGKSDMTMEATRPDMLRECLYKVYADLYEFSGV